MFWRIFKIVRVPNLFIIVLIEYILHQNILLKLLRRATILPELNIYQFYTIVIYSLLITLSGYIINDLYDIQTDKVNKPHQNWVMLIGLRNTRMLYVLFSFFSIVISTILALQLNKLEYIWITPLMIFLLWAYSRYFKSKTLIGNIWVAVFCVLVIILIWLSEEKSIHQLIQHLYIKDFKQAFWIFSYYSIFAFMITVCREIIKDVQDIEGDKRIGANTYPILNGLPATKQLLWFLLIILIILVNLVLYYFSAIFSIGQLSYCILFITLPIIISMVLIYKANSTRSFTYISQLVKLIMISGTLFLLSFPI